MVGQWTITIACSTLKAPSIGLNRFGYRQLFDADHRPNLATCSIPIRTAGLNANWLSHSEWEVAGSSPVILIFGM